MVPFSWSVKMARRSCQWSFLWKHQEASISPHLMTTRTLPTVKSGERHLLLYAVIKSVVRDIVLREDQGQPQELAAVPQLLCVVDLLQDLPLRRGEDRG